MMRHLLVKVDDIKEKMTEYIRTETEMKCKIEQLEKSIAGLIDTQAKTKRITSFFSVSGGIIVWTAKVFGLLTAVVAGLYGLYKFFK